MRSARIVLLVLIALCWIGVPTAQAQRTSEPSVLILANNRGIFACTLNLAIFNFGNVDADGTDHGTPGVVANGRNAADDGGSYENAAGTVQWNCRAAPPSTVALALASATTDHVGALPPDNLAARVPAGGGGTSTGYQDFTSGNDLITGMSVGNGGAAVGGDLDLRLSVFDVDPLGSTVWVLRLRASGSP